MANISFVRVLAAAKGFRARSKNCRTVARNAVERAMRHSQRNRKLKARNFRASWIQSINAAARDAGTNYSYFMAAAKHENIGLNRRMLSILAQTEPLTFKAITHHVVRQTQAVTGYRELPVIKTHQDFGLLVSNIVTETVPVGKIALKRKPRRAVANYY